MESRNLLMYVLIASLVLYVISLHEFLDTCYWELHCMYTNFCLKNLCCHRVRFEIGSYSCSYSLLLYKYVFHTYMGTFAVCGWYVCNAGCICS